MINIKREIFFIATFSMIFGCANKKTSDTENFKKLIVSEVNLISDLYEGTNAQGLKVIFSKKINNSGDTNYIFGIRSFMDITHPLNNPSISYLKTKSPLKYRISTYELLRLDKKKLNDLILNHQIDIKKFPIDQQVFMDKLLDISDNLYENDDEKENALFQLYKRRRAIKNWVFQIKSKDLDGFVGSWVDFELYNFIFRFWVSNKISEAIDMTLGDDDLELKQYHIKSQFDDFQLGDWVQVDGYIESDEYGFGVVLENPPKLDITSISRY